MASLCQSDSGCKRETIKFDFGGYADEEGGEVGGPRVCVMVMVNATEVSEWAADPLGTQYRRERVGHGFGNTLSKSDVHLQKDELTRKNLNVLVFFNLF